MLKVSFEINGRPLNPANLADAFEAAMLDTIEKQLRSKLSDIRDPETGEFPVVAVRGRSLDNLSIEVTGSSKLVALVKRKLGSENVDGKVILQEKGMAASNEIERRDTPCAFLCHASEDNELARRIAEDFQKNGVDTFFDEWEIGPGDSIRQKIEAGLDRCTHFVALLTPNSLPKPWVQVEMDAGFIRKVSGKCRFIALRYGVSAESLSTLLKTLHSPSLDEFERDITALINLIHGITRKPPLGPPPRAIRESLRSETGLSPAAEMIARYMVENSEHGDSFDPQLDEAELRKVTGLSDDDLIDAVDELEGRGFVRKHVTFGSGSLGFAFITSEAALFVSLDKYYKDWDSEADALQIAADMVNGGADGIVSSMAGKYGWPPRRMNPAVNFLVERDLVRSSGEMSTHPWCHHWIDKNNRTRRFVRDRS